MPSYDLYQQTFTLSLAINSASGSTGSAADVANILKGKLGDLLGNTDVQQLIGTWTLAWGPAVWEHPLDLRGYADNAVAVFHNADSNTYVCAIAATNANSLFDWTVEDFWVSDKVRWLYNPALGTPWISAATNFGIGVLLSLRDPATGTYLSDFLHSAASSKATLIFAGHSLAGALSPTLAMVLYGTAAQRAAWQNVYVYPTAGATPGNLAFSAAFALQFPAPTPGAQPWQRWNTLLWNDLDVVPHAWEAINMARVPFLYTGADAVKIEVGAIVAYALYEAGLDYIQLPNFQLKGTQHSASVDDLKGFFAELFYQHVPAYLTLIGVTELEPYLKQLPQQPDDSSAQAALSAAQANASAVAASAVPAALKAAV